MPSPHPLRATCIQEIGWRSSLKCGIYDVFPQLYMQTTPVTFCDEMLFIILYSRNTALSYSMILLWRRRGCGGKARVWKADPAHRTIGFLIFFPIQTLVSLLFSRIYVHLDKHTTGALYEGQSVATPYECLILIWLTSIWRGFLCRTRTHAWNGRMKISTYCNFAAASITIKRQQ